MSSSTAWPARRVRSKRRSRNISAPTSLFYRADGPQGCARARRGSGIRSCAGRRPSSARDFKTGEGVVHVVQPAAALQAASAAIPEEPWRLGALHAATTLTGSALIALALLDGAISVDDAWTAAHVDEDWNMDQWGRDDRARTPRLSPRRDAGGGTCRSNANLEACGPEALAHIRAASTSRHSGVEHDLFRSCSLIGTTPPLADRARLSGGSRRMSPR